METVTAERRPRQRALRSGGGTGLGEGELGEEGLDGVGGELADVVLAHVGEAVGAVLPKR